MQHRFFTSASVSPRKFRQFFHDVRTLEVAKLLYRRAARLFFRIAFGDLHEENKSGFLLLIVTWRLNDRASYLDFFHRFVRTCSMLSAPRSRLRHCVRCLPPQLNFFACIANKSDKCLLAAHLAQPITDDEANALVLRSADEVFSIPATRGSSCSEMPSTARSLSRLAPRPQPGRAGGSSSRHCLRDRASRRDNRCTRVSF